MTDSIEVCAEPDCQRDATVELYDPRGTDRVVCPAHARVLATQEGVVARPLDTEDWP